MALVTDPYLGILTLQLASATSLALNPSCVLSIPCATPFLNTSGVPSEDYTVVAYEEKSTSLAVDAAGITSSVYELVVRTIPFWEFSDHTNACFATMTSHLQLELATGFDFTIGFNKGAYAVATSVELDASQSATVGWIQAMPTKAQSYFVSAYLPQFTENFSFDAFAAPTESRITVTPSSTASATAPPYGTALSASYNTSTILTAYRRSMQPQEPLQIESQWTRDNRAILATVITLSFLLLFGGCMLMFFWVRSTRSRSSETSGSIETSHTAINEAPSLAATMSETSLRTEPVNLQGNFSNSEASAPRHSLFSAQRFQLGSSTSSNSSNSSGGELTTEFNSLDDPFSDTAIISSLAREESPPVSPTQCLSHARGG